MKKYLFLAAIAAVALAACAKIENDEPAVNVDEPVLFSAYSGRAATKADPSIANVVDLANAGGFGVFAYYTGTTAYASATVAPNFMYNQQVTGTVSTVSGTSSVSKWTYSPVKYWPNNTSSQVNGTETWTDKVSFFGYAPYVAVTNKTNGTTANTVGITKVTGNATTLGTEEPTVTYVVATNPAQSVDFLYAEPKLDQTKQTTTGTVEFAFKHALTRLGFTVEGVFDETDADADGNDVDTNTKIYITSLTVNKAGGFSTGGTFNLATKTWTANTTYAPLEITADNIPADLKTNGTGVTKTQVNIPYDNTDNSNQYFMFLPDADAVDYQVNIVYDVITADPALVGEQSKITNNITKKASIKMEAGKAYTLRLQLGMTTVKMLASVDNWTNGTNTPIWLPINN